MSTYQVAIAQSIFEAHDLYSHEVDELQYGKNLVVVGELESVVAYALKELEAQMDDFYSDEHHRCVFKRISANFHVDSVEIHGWVLLEDDNDPNYDQPDFRAIVMPTDVVTLGTPSTSDHGNQGAYGENEPSP